MTTNNSLHASPVLFIIIKNIKLKIKLKYLLNTTLLLFLPIYKLMILTTILVNLQTEFLKINLKKI